MLDDHDAIGGEEISLDQTLEQWRHEVYVGVRRIRENPAEWFGAEQVDRRDSSKVSRDDLALFVEPQRSSGGAHPADGARVLIDEDRMNCAAGERLEGHRASTSEEVEYAATLESAARLEGRRQRLANPLRRWTRTITARPGEDSAR